MMTCCDSECAYVNDCIIGGYECRRCGEFFCAGQMDGDLCDNCRMEIEREKREEEEEEEDCPCYLRGMCVEAKGDAE